MFRLTTRLLSSSNWKKGDETETRKHKRRKHFLNKISECCLDGAALYIKVLPYNNRCTVKWEKSMIFLVSHTVPLDKTVYPCVYLWRLWACALTSLIFWSLYKTSIPKTGLNITWPFSYYCGPPNCLFWSSYIKYTHFPLG
jgi:hypothetical protein